jgi:hypothetical protein
VPQYDARTAIAARDRDTGVRRVGRLTRRVGVAGAALSALIGVAFAHHAEASTAPTHQEQHQRQRQQSGGIVIPAKPPQPASGSGQVNSGAS